MSANRMRKYIASALGLAVLFAIAGCALNEKSPIGFRLPEGSIWKGKTAFVELGCIQCHSVKDEDLMPDPSQNRDIHIKLGGEVTRVKTYGQLVTSIINPSHVIKMEHRDKYTDPEGNSMMPDFTDKMSVGQMIDIAEFLQARYEVVIPNHAYEEYGYLPQ